MSKKLRAGIIGSGVFGGYHAGKYAASDDVDLTAIYDVNNAAAQTLAQKHSASGYSGLDAFLEHVDIVTIASPAASHFGNASRALKAGKSVLIEKPIAQTPGQAQILIDLAKERDLVLAVGHQERLVFQAMGLYDTPEKPTRIEASRMGPWSVRGSDVSVTMDLLIHDADLVLSLFGGGDVNVLNANAKSVHTTLPDEITAHIKIGTGEAVLTSSRICEQRDRKMKIEYPSGIVSIDFVARSFETTTPFQINKNFAGTEIGRDPLGANVYAFIDAVLGKRSAPVVDGPAGLRALNLVKAIDSAAGF